MLDAQLELTRAGVHSTTAQTSSTGAPISALALSLIRGTEDLSLCR
jgi:hypothetical protein